MEIFNLLLKLLTPGSKLMLTCGIRLLDIVIESCVIKLKFFDGNISCNLWCIRRSGMGGSHSTAAEDSPGGTKDTGAGHQQQQSSVVSEADIYPLVIKKEPEDLTRRNLRQHQQHQHVIHQQHHSDSRIMCTNTNNSNGGGPDKSGDQQQQHSTGSVISRVLADGELVHEMIPRLESIAQSQHSLSDGRDPTGGSVIHIRRPLSSAHHDGEATALSSAVVLDLARAGQNQQQQQQYSTTSYSAGSSIQPVGSNNHGYDLSTGAGAAAVSYGVGETSAYTTISSSPSTALRQQQQQTTYATPTPVGSDPFYRDYFNNNSSGVNGGSNDPQQYARAVAQLAYSNSGEVHESAFVDRFIRGQAGVYKQQQQGTGLTVDLPSPDSGIGVDAVTPRDQSVAQQVGWPNMYHIYQMWHELQREPSLTTKKNIRDAHWIICISKR